MYNVSDEIKLNSILNKFPVEFRDEYNSHKNHVIEKIVDSLMCENEKMFYELVYYLIQTNDKLQESISNYVSTMPMKNKIEIKQETERFGENEFIPIEKISEGTFSTEYFIILKKIDGNPASLFVDKSLVVEKVGQYFLKTILAKVDEDKRIKTVCLPQETNESGDVWFDFEY